MRLFRLVRTLVTAVLAPFFHFGDLAGTLARQAFEGRLSPPVAVAVVVGPPASDLLLPVPSRAGSAAAQEPSRASAGARPPAGPA
ncbi:hypothetical protein [Streptomyces sp. NPDC006012]|uniref:hypothetical protein n=1 Tax=Streptomyces sp. NPDC006012 TaxID=3364739 RepID=UPI0036A68571